MAFENDYELNLGSDRFLCLCTKLNSATRMERATWSADIFSGGFKFSDEVPDEMIVSNDIEIVLSLTTLMRCLWAYRMSLVEGKPRADLVATWELTRTFAPRWAGFAPDRCSSKMQSLVDRVRAKKKQFDKEIDDLEARMQARSKETNDTTKKRPPGHAMEA